MFLFLCLLPYILILLLTLTTEAHAGYFFIFIRLDAVLCVMSSEDRCQLHHFTNLKYAMFPAIRCLSYTCEVKKRCV